MRTTLTTVSLCASLFVLPSQANAEEWQCKLSEPPPSTSSFDYDIALEDGLTARIEKTPTKLGVNPQDDAEAGTSRAIILQNSHDGLVLASGSAGPTQYGRAVYGDILVINRHDGTAVWSYVEAAQNMGFFNPGRLGKCTQTR